MYIYKTLYIYVYIYIYIVKVVTNRFVKCL